MSPVVSLHHNEFNEHGGDATMDGTRWFLFDTECEMAGNDTRGRRHNLVRGLSSLVWEVRTTVLRWSTRGSKPHRSRYENGDVWHCLIVPPSVYFVDKRRILELEGKSFDGTTESGIILH